ncbi:MAG: hypothetical protein JWL60_1318 [Gemmatimonadetes bacterium]|jgi:hypothetical protein|nr:hypothetical protein [Gemmatimonadota bacterium]
MTLRTVVDADGVTWELWEVQPSLVEKRDASDGAPGNSAERRRVRSVRMRVSPDMREGWLAIRSHTERRRIAPIPAGWQELSDEALLRLVARADSPGPRRRLIE